MTKSSIVPLSDPRIYISPSPRMRARSGFWIYERRLVKCCPVIAIPFSVSIKIPLGNGSSPARRITRLVFGNSIFPIIHIPHSRVLHFSRGIRPLSPLSRCLEMSSGRRRSSSPRLTIDSLNAGTSLRVVQQRHLLRGHCIPKKRMKKISMPSTSRPMTDYSQRHLKIERSNYLTSKTVKS